MRTLDLIEQDNYDYGYDDARAEIRDMLIAEAVHLAKSIVKLAKADSASYSVVTGSYVTVCRVINQLFEDELIIKMFFLPKDAPKGMTDDQWVAYLVTWKGK